LSRNPVKDTALCDKRKHVASLDLSAAFEIVSRPLLIRRMRVLGIPEVIIIMIQDWLIDRMAYCEVGE